MCQRVQCGRCGKATYAGCGQHVEDVLGAVPAQNRCQCHLASANADIARARS